MARTALIEKEGRRQDTVKAYRAKKADLKEQLRKAYIAVAANEESPEAVLRLQMKLQDLPRNSSKTRLRNRCRITGRSRGVYRKFGLGRNKLREYAMMGMITGLKKASW